MAILTVGTKVTGEYSFEAVASALTQHVGNWAVFFFGFGLFVAGFSSAITAPLASAITAKSLFEKYNPDKWKTQSFYFKTVWVGVLLVGLGFGLAQVKPIPAIILAQALNGFILPFISIFLIFVINNPVLMGNDHLNSWTSNILMGIVVWITLILGLINVMNASINVMNQLFELNMKIPESTVNYLIIVGISFVITLLILRQIYKIRTLSNQIAE